MQGLKGAYFPTSFEKEMLIHIEILAQVYNALDIYVSKHFSKFNYCSKAQ